MLFKKVLKNGAWGAFGTGTGRILNLVAMILLARSLSVHEFGYFSLIQATLGVFAVFAGAGLGVTATRFLAQFRHTDKSRAGSIISFVRATALFTTTLMAGIVFLLSGVIAAGLVDPEAQQLFTIAIIIGGFFFALQTWRGVQDAILMGLERFRDVALLRLADGVAILALVPVLADRQGLLGAVSGQVCASAAIAIVGLWHIRRVLRTEEIKVTRGGLRREWKLIGGFSLPSLMSNVVGTPVLWLGVYILSQQSDGIEQIALYNAAYQWHGPLIFIPMVLCSSSMPSLVQAWVQGDLTIFRRLFWGVAATAIAFGLIPALALIFAREAIMSAYGPDFIAGQGALIFLMLAAPLHAFANICTSTLQSMQRAWLVMGTSILWGMTFAAIGYLTIPLHGASGLAAALAASYAVLCLVRSVAVLYTMRQHTHKHFQEANT